MRTHPSLFETNAVFFLRSLEKKYRKKMTLASVPDKEWKRLADCGYDLVWLMGVWKRSPGAQKWALADKNLRQYLSRVFPRYDEEDIIASAYAVYDYSLDASLGSSNEDLYRLKEKLNSLGLGLILDFVPNHLAFDHPWTRTHPERFVRGSAADHKKHPEVFFKASANNYLAHGKDPYFIPWVDTVQVNFFSENMRQALAGELLRVAGLCDGVRCDMAMLAINEIFKNTWSKYVDFKTIPGKEFWEQVIASVKKKYPGFLFIAEVYWNRENQLQRLGFDYTYDKVLYDRLQYDSAASVNNYLKADPRSQQRMIRFLENHDEERSLNVFGREKAKAAAIISYTVPGARMFFSGQSEGHARHLPIQVLRDPQEKTDKEIHAFYLRLQRFVNDPLLHQGNWQLFECVPAWPGNPSQGNLVAYGWQSQEKKRLIVVNYSAQESQARIFTPFFSSAGGEVILNDHFSGEKYFRDSALLSREGLYVSLKPWQAHLFEID